MTALSVQWQATVARHFQRAALSYADASALQKASTEDLLNTCQAQGVVLEVGAGQGELASALAARDQVVSVVAVDVSEAMLRNAAPTAKLQCVVASALALPLKDQSVDSIVSHFSLHWCLAPSAAAQELHRVLRPNGLLQVAIPVAGSLAPLHGANGDGALLLSVAEWQRAFSATSVAANSASSKKPEWIHQSAELKTYTCHFASAAEWLAYLRAMGVTAKPQAQARLQGKQAYSELLKRINAWTEADGIPFSFNVWHAQFRAG